MHRCPRCQRLCHSTVATGDTLCNYCRHEEIWCSSPLTHRPAVYDGAEQLDHRDGSTPSGGEG